MIGELPDFLRDHIDDPAGRSSHPLPEVVAAFFERIELAQPTLNTFITVLRDDALREADRVERLRAGGADLPLYGFTFALKDNIDVGGVATTVGSRAYLENVAGTDAEVVERLRGAGAVILGKAALYELAYGLPSAAFGTCPNAWDHDRISGGSSSGSAVALAADLCVGALGTDTGGSVRMPAALNGVTGLRPTFGRVSNRGVFPLARSFDTVGPMARSARDVATILSVIEGYDPGDSRSARKPPAAGDDQKPVAQMRAGVPREFFFEGLEDGVAGAVNQAIDVLRELGVDVQDVALPGGPETVPGFIRMLRAEAASVHGDHTEEELGLINEEIRRRIGEGQSIAGPEVAELIEKMHRWRRSVDNAMESVDFLITPTTPSVAPLRDQGDQRAVGGTISTLSSFLHCWAWTDRPSLSIPCGLDATGMPVGLQVIGRAWSDEVLLRVATAYQERTGWHLRRPYMGTTA